MYKNPRVNAQKFADTRIQNVPLPGQITAVDSLSNTMSIQTPKGQVVVDIPQRASGGGFDRFIPTPGTPVLLASDVYSRRYVPIAYIPKISAITGAADPLSMASDPTAAFGLGGLEVAGTGVPLYADTGMRLRKISTGESDSQTEGGAHQYKSVRGNQMLGAGAIRTTWSLDAQRIVSAAPVHQLTTVGHQQGIGKNGFAIGDELRFGLVFRPHPVYGSFREIPIRDTALSASKLGGFAKEYALVLRNAWNPVTKSTEVIPPYLLDVRAGVAIDDFGFPILDMMTGQPSRYLAKYFDRVGAPLMIGVDAQGTITVNQSLNTTAAGALFSLKSVYMMIEQLFNVYSTNFMVNLEGLVKAHALTVIKAHQHPISPDNPLLAKPSAELQVLVGGAFTTSTWDVV